MKRVFFSLAIALSGVGAQAQTEATAPAPTPVALSVVARLPEVDKSPLDMCYYPANYPVLKIQDKATEPLVARVIYSRPMANNRAVFGELVEWNKVWRLGANEATELELYRDVKIGGKKIIKGKYTIYAIPSTDAWTLILNKDTDTWGAFKYDDKKDVVRVQVPVKKTGAPVNAFSMMFEKGSNDTILLDIAWENAMVALPIALK
ncbi:Protein of unknown function [Cnuella takakiae]|uniref:DUF2911 domain-containing protein n=1 Tax=Cnuella takakiae TaxID=1302690 RepID=A0A1M5D5M3_9BACT|nr:DUF2911 domain-containing protein [Cnuella takakiae]OLY94101.1 hypothetical protein BUE76_21065 [Cnuella takakiae]SHF62140.1 Protein of unknown function [Cnuella takakiae]